MRTTQTRSITAALTAALAMAACSTASSGAMRTSPQPDTGGSGERAAVEKARADSARYPYTEADVRFMTGMIGHHSQAIEMTDLLKTRTESEDMRKLALRIEVSQADEIKMMQHWLEVRGQEVPGEHAHHMHGAKLMPGMLSPEEMARLAAAKGAEFDRLFLEYMIKHHAGALTMVQDLFATPGAGQEAEIFAFASDVDADQRMEIDRMGAMLKELQK